MFGTKPDTFLNYLTKYFASLYDTDGWSKLLLYKPDEILGLGWVFICA